MNKKEVQDTIVKNQDDEISREEFYSVLKQVSPGTGIRKALDGIISSGKGALIVIENEFLSPLTDGGFKVNCRFAPQKLIELSKMDGAIILSNDFKKIKSVNVLLTPDSKIRTSQTGTRHKAAERTAKQISGLVIAISERKREITIFYKNRRYPLRNTSEIIRKANEYLQILEKQRNLFDLYLEVLDRLELRSYTNLNHAVKTIQKGKSIIKISEELKKYLVELGIEGKLLEMRLKEILSDVEKETNLIVKDYSTGEYEKAIAILGDLSYEEILDKGNIVNVLNHGSSRELVQIAGWRLLSKTTLTEPEIVQVVNDVGFEKILSADIKSPLETEAFPENRFTLLKVELERLKLGL